MTVQYLTILQDTLREVSFVSFQFEMDWTECTYQQLILRSKTLPPKLQFTSLDKIVFKKHEKTKADFLSYMVKMSDFLMPFLKDRAVTVIRYPHGAPGESFFKKTNRTTRRTLSQACLTGATSTSYAAAYRHFYGWLISWRLNFTFRFRQCILKGPQKSSLILILRQGMIFLWQWRLRMC